MRPAAHYHSRRLESHYPDHDMAVLLRLFQLAWEHLDAILVAQRRQHHADSPFAADSRVPLAVGSRFGTLRLRPVRRSSIPPTTPTWPSCQTSIRIAGAL